MALEDFHLEPDSVVVDEVVDSEHGVHYLVYLQMRSGPHGDQLVVGIRTSESSPTAPSSGGAHGAGEDDLTSQPALSWTQLDESLRAYFGLTRPGAKAVRLRDESSLIEARLRTIEEPALGVPVGTKVYSLVTPLVAQSLDIVGPPD